MSLLATNCHGYSATGITGWPASPDKVWALSWIKVDTSTGGAYRAAVQFSDDNLNGTTDYFGIHTNDAPTANCRTTNINSATGAPADLLLWQTANQDKWFVACTVLDRTQSATDLKFIYGREAATAISSTTQTNSGDIAAFEDQLVSLYVACDLRKVSSGTGTTNDDSDGMKVAYIAIGHGSVPSQADIQSVIDGMHPADLAGVWEYWDLTSSSAGLTGALQGITLAPFGGSATTTWDGADNPTVSAPSGGNQLVTVANVTQVNSVSGAAVYQATANGTLTTAPLKNNAGTLLANETGATAYIHNVSTGALIVAKTGQTTNASGVMTVVDAAITPATQYRIVVKLASAAEGLDKLTAT